MSAHSTPATETGPKKPWFRTPHKLVWAVGLFMGVFTMASGVIPQFTHWHGTKEPAREVFDGIPGALQVAFYTVIPVLLVWGSFAFAARVRNWERGAPDRRATTPKNITRRLKDFRAGAYMRTLLRDSAAGLMHSMIYFGFMALLGVTTVLEIDHQLPESLKFLHGRTYQAYAFGADLAGVAFLAIGVELFVRRDLGVTTAIPTPRMPAALLGVGARPHAAARDLLHAFERQLAPFGHLLREVGIDGIGLRVHLRQLFGRPWRHAGLEQGIFAHAQFARF